MRRPNPVGDLTMSKLNQTISEVTNIAAHSQWPQDSAIIAIIATADYDRFHNLEINELIDLGIVDDNLVDDLYAMSRDQYETLRYAVLGILSAQ